MLLTSVQSNLFSEIFNRSPDLIAIGIVVAIMAILGFVVFLSNKKSITNISFFIFSFITIAYGIDNFLNYKVHTALIALILLRLTVFFAIWHVFLLFTFIYVFPEEKIDFPKWYKYLLLPLVIIVSIINLTKYVFPGIQQLGNGSSATTGTVGQGILLFVGLVVFILLGIFYQLIKKTRKSSGLLRKQFELIASGTIITLTFLVIFCLILPALFANVTFIPFAPFYLLPLIVLAAYSIIKYHLLNIKTIATQILVFALWILLLTQTLIANTLGEFVLEATVFIVTVFIGIFLIRSVMKEVRQREEIQKLAEDLSKANDRLKELDQMKTEFVSLATHQIRAPLTAIKGYISLIQEGDYGPVSEEVHKAIEIIFNETNNLVTIVADFLDVSRIEQGRMKYDFSDFDVEALVQEIIRDYKPNVETKGLKLEHTFDQAGRYTVHADKGKVKQVIGNIIDNSIKYTPTGSITVETTNKGNNILISVKDTGVGIPSGTLPKLFQKFTRAENANDANILGTGLGLYVAKNMVESMKGRIWAESAGQGKGSQFYIELPISTGEKLESSVDAVSAFKATPLKK